jgi:hypothetical protein
MDIRDVPWSTLRHAYGPATDIPALWEKFLAVGDEHGEFGNTVCHQGTVYSATPPLVPFAIEVAKSRHPRRPQALVLLGWIVACTGGPLFQAELMARTSFRNPFTGKTVRNAPPDPAALAAENAWVEAMKREIVAEIDSWLAAAGEPDPEVRMGAHALLGDIAEHAGERRAEAALRVALGSAAEGEERRRLKLLLDEMDERRARDGGDAPPSF